MSDFFYDIDNYRACFSVSTLIKLFEKKGLLLTRALVEKYISNKIIPSPKGRYYFKQHIYLIVFAISLSCVFALAEIQMIYLKLFPDYMNIDDTALIKIKTTYEFYIDALQAYEESQDSLSSLAMPDTFIKQLALIVCLKRVIGKTTTK